MGVKDLWNVLSSAGRKISIETLSGKRMAIDISIWIYQFSLAKRKDETMPQDIFILIGIFSRICKLLFHKIKPIFVFDGVAPHLKARELRKRQALRDNSDQLIKSMAKQLLSMKNLPTQPVNNIEIKDENKEEDEDSDFEESSEDENYITIPLSFHEQRLYNSLNNDEKHLIADKVTQPNNPISNLISDPQKFSETQIEWLQYRNEIRQNMKHLRGIDLDEKPVKRIKQTGQFYEYEKYKIDNSIFEDGNNGEENGEEMGYGYIAESEEENEENKNKEIECGYIAENDEENNEVINDDNIINISPIKSQSSDRTTSSESGWESITVSPVKKMKCKVIIIKPEDIFDRDDNEIENVNENVEEKEDEKENKDEDEINDEKENEKEKENESQKENKDEIESDNDNDSDIPSINRITSPLSHLHKYNNTTTQIQPSIESINEISLSIISQQPQPQQNESIETKNESESENDENEKNKIEPFPIIHSTFLNSDSTITDSQKSEDDYSYQRTVVFDQDILQADLVESIIELLKLFGLPYIISPAEAEAQCAYLNYNGMVDGVITNDSDTFLFGGNTVYRNFFIDYKYIEYYNIDNILTELGISREDMIAYALLVGSDYAVGVAGIGPVKALEILSVFNGLNGLKDFRQWINNNYLEQEIYLKNKEFFDKKARDKRKWILTEDFPQDIIIKAYRSPSVDLSLESPTWGNIQKDKLEEYCKKTFKWNDSKIDDQLKPILVKETEQIVQTKMDHYITVEMNQKVTNIQSERLKDAFDLLKQQKSLFN